MPPEETVMDPVPAPPALDSGDPSESALSAQELDADAEDEEA